ncbi:glycoside hydrolase family 172 protein [Botrimarina sp.]|uniref:glycoside hydrolase family 172 protein n=1 Tax=Botrimarina sp. TaxID=2795802 RepID=UPI0032EF178E
MNWSTPAALAALLLCPLAALAESRVTLESLLEEMVERETVARLPEPPYECRQASSYDRDSSDPGNDATWFANMDRSQFVRIDQRDGRKEYVMMDETGPGAIVRIWATWHGPGGGEFSNGTIRVYFDGEAEPTIEGPISEFISRGMLTGPPLSQGVSEKTPYRQRGHNLYLPIPYARGCKITYSTDVLLDRGAYEGEALYYQINFRRYDDGTPVQTFSLDRLAAARDTLRRVQQKLQERWRGDSDAWQTRQWTARVAPGGESVVARLEGPAAVRRLRLRLSADDPSQALRSTVLKIVFDGEQTVWAPVGDFFGTGYQVRPYASWYSRVTPEGDLACWWVMPFAESAEVSLVNVGDQTVEAVEGDLAAGPWEWDDRSLHFSSAWRQYSELPTRTNDEAGGTGAFDVNYVTVEGRGVYVGDTLTVFNGAASWWGEGDEKIYVDGERRPSHFGTGTEDYYGYAWCRPEFFEAPFHAQPDGTGNLNGGYSVNSRWRALDAIPFDESIRFDMEMWHWAKTKVNYAPTTFFYARPGAQRNVAADPDSAGQEVVLRREEIVDVFYVDDAIEGEVFTVVRSTGGEVSRQTSSQYDWSGEGQLWWIDAAPGDKLELSFPTERSGRRRVLANLTKARDYAVVRVWLNGEESEVGEIDRYNRSVDTDLVDLGVFDLKEGDNQLTFEIVGANPDAIQRHMVGLDYLKLEDAP